MRQFVFAKGVASNATANGTGQVGVFDMSTMEKVTSSNVKPRKEYVLVVNTPATHQNAVIPIHTHHFSFVKSEYSNLGDADLPAMPDLSSVEVEISGEYTMIIALLGKKFNERNKFTASIYVSDEQIGKADGSYIQEQIVKQVKANASFGVTIDEDNNFALTDDSVVGFKVLFTDLLSDKEGVEYFKHVQNDAKYITDLAEKAAADNGIEYTYREANADMYPNYPLNPLKQADAADNGFVIFTLTFAEPRVTKTTDEAIRQVVQVALPTGDAGIAALETQLTALAGA